MSPTISVSSQKTPRSNISHVSESEVSDRSQRSSRSGRDPPAASPFPSSVPAAHQYQHHRPASVSSHHSFHSHGQGANQFTEDSELSRIEEDASILADDVSAVSAFTSNTTTPLKRRIRGGGGAGMVSSLTATATGGSRDGRESVIGSRTPMSSSSMQTRRTSQIMCDKFAELATETAHELEKIWDVVGTGPDDRAAQLNDLMDQLCDLCGSKVTYERNLIEMFRTEIASRKKEWMETCRALKLDERDPPSDRFASGNGDTVPLQVELETLEMELESVRAMRAEAETELKASRTRIVESYAALNGCSIEETESSEQMAPWGDLTSDLTQERKDLFRAKAEEMEETLGTRSRAVVSLLKDCQNLILDLKIVPQSCLADGDDVTGSVEYGDYGPGGIDEVGRSEDDAKILKSLVTRSGGREDGRRSRSGRRASSDYTIASPFESSTCTGIAKDALERLKNRVAELNGEKERRRRMLQEMGGKISLLWNKLKIPEVEQRTISHDFQSGGLSLATIRKGEREIVRLHELKAAMNGDLIREQRKNIEMMWAQINASDEERESFSTYFDMDQDEELTDELLHTHEEYAASLNAKLEQMKPILELIEKRENILSDRFELEHLQRDPDRLKQRGANLTKQLMKEEKMSRRVKKELPKITQLLEKKLMEWYKEHRPSVSDITDSETFTDLGHFMCNNEPYLKTIETQEDDWKMRKERGELERQRKRHEEISASATTAFGSTYAKLPGKKWYPACASKVPRNLPKPSGAADVRPRSASTTRGQPLADVSSSRQNSRAASRPKHNREKKATSQPQPTVPNRAKSAPRMRF